MHTDRLKTLLPGTGRVVDVVDRALLLILCLECGDRGTIRSLLYEAITGNEAEGRGIAKISCSKCHAMHGYAAYDVRTSIEQGICELWTNDELTCMQPNDDCLGVLRKFKASERE